MNLNKELAEALAELKPTRAFKIFRGYVEKEHVKLLNQLRSAEGEKVFTAQGGERTMYELLKCMDQATDYNSKHK